MIDYKLQGSDKLIRKSIPQIFMEVNAGIGGYGRRVIAGGIFVMFLVIFIAAINVIAPSIIGDASQIAIRDRDKQALLTVVLGLGGLYVVTSVASYLQILIMGWIGQNILSRLRSRIFARLQELPLAFFNQNKSGDLISRINNDTDKLNQAFSETLLRFVGNIFVIIGTAIAMLVINPILGLLALMVAAVLLLTTNLFSGLIRSLNKKAFARTGNLSAEVQESISNYKVMVAFGRKDYFINAFGKVNSENKQAATLAATANGLLTPLYDFGSNVALFLVYLAGINLISQSSFTFLGINITASLEFGVLVTYILYLERFYSPLRIMASLFSSLQTSIAAWSRISELLNLPTDQTVLPIKNTVSSAVKSNQPMVELRNMSFGYQKDIYTLKNVSMQIMPGKTYAFVGPTGGGKSTTAAIIACLYRAAEGEVLFKGKDIHSYTQSELATSIGFILQDPILFSGSIRDNIVYGNEQYRDFTSKQLEKVLIEKELGKVLEKFPGGLDTPVDNSSENISLGQKQLVAFIRVMLRSPELIILDEATANIDTVTEQLLEEILVGRSMKEGDDKKTTTKIIIAHRLNTVKSADEIYFIAAGQVTGPVKFEQALELINSNKAVAA